MAISRTAKDVFSGTAGGIAQVLVGQPLDMLKVRLQTAPQGTYNGMGDVAMRILKQDGPLGFYKGTLTPLLGVGLCVSIQFGVVEKVKRDFAMANARAAGSTDTDALAGVGPKAFPLSTAQLYTAGVAAGVANAFVAGPVEHIRIRLQTQATKIYHGPVDCAKKIVASSGAAGIFKGMVPTLIREGHGMGTYFLIYEAVVGYKLKKDNLTRAELPATWAMLGGAISGPALWTMVYPFDVVKSRMQTDSLDASKRQYKGMIDCFRQVAAQSGWKGFFRGLIPTLTRAPLSNAATFVTYEFASRHLESLVSH
ncbi:unnamed protein product [Parajaminaea phylloscopi]